MGDVPLPSGSTSQQQHYSHYQGGTLNATAVASSQPSHLQEQTVQHGKQLMDPHYGAGTAVAQQQSFPSMFSDTMSQPPGRPPIATGPYNMNAMNAALPQQHHPQQQHQHHQEGYDIVAGGGSRQRPFHNPQTVSSQNIMGHMHQHQHQSLAYMPGQQYLSQQSPQHVQGYYTSHMVATPQQSMQARQAIHAYYPSTPIVASPNHPHHHHLAQQATTFYYPQSQYATQGHVLQAQMTPGQYVMQGQTHQPDARTSGQTHIHEHAVVVSGTQSQDHSANNSLSDKYNSVVRGPPRKPRQSGHAIWIGNLPPQTDLMSLVHHVCKEAPGLESLFLISKSNCAFANFKDEETCIAAQQKLHDSKFQSVRLVSRLRKSSVEGSTGITAPTGPSSVSAASAGGGDSETKSSSQTLNGDERPPQQHQVARGTTPSILPHGTEMRLGVSGGGSKSSSGGESTPQREKFFILKSLTMEDLELSVRTGIWATQSHNEETLNNAFKTVDNVYLVFSANKSGEYFGYARMTSPINEDPAAAIEFAPKTQSATDLDLPKAIPTEATEFAPKGRIIDDSARGTIFWEAERDDTDTDVDADAGESAIGEDGEDDFGGGENAVDGDTGGADGADEVDGAGRRGGEGEGRRASGAATMSPPPSPTKAWGKPFQLEWISTARLPFYRTRGLRNPWNSNREVKIARDGTELEPSVGRRLIALFGRAAAGGGGGGAVPQSPGAPPVVPSIRHITGYPPPAMGPHYS